MSEKQIEIAYDASFEHALIDRIGEFRAAIIKIKMLNDETIKDYKVALENTDDFDNIIRFSSLIAGLEEANRNLRDCMRELNWYIF